MCLLKKISSMFLKFTSNKITFLHYSIDYVFKSICACNIVFILRALKILTYSYSIDKESEKKFLLLVKELKRISARNDNVLIKQCENLSIVKFSCKQKSRN